MPFQIIRSDITKVKADVIVNTANPRPVIGRGTDWAIYRAAGESKMLEDRRKIGNILPGHAAVTPAYDLPASYVVHTVGPVWQGGGAGERDILRSCYRESFAQALSLKAESIAFPLISSGVYGFPKEEALHIALSETERFLEDHDMNVILAVLDTESFVLSERLSGAIDSYIDEHGADVLARREYGDFFPESRSFSAYREALEETAFSRRASAGVRKSDQKHTAMPDAESARLESVFSELSAPSLSQDSAEESLDAFVSHAGDTFQQRLFELIDQKGLDDVTVYKQANIDRKVFSKIRCNADYKPKKKTAVAFAIALHLDMQDMVDLLSRAEIAFSPSSKFDLIITYFVQHRNYDIYEINAALFKYGQPILGE